MSFAHFLYSLALMAVAVQHAHAAGTLRDELAPIATQIKNLAEEERQTAVAVGEFSGPAQLDANSGPGIQELLTDALKATQLAVTKTANLSVKGRYARVEDRRNPELIIVKLTVQVLDKSDDVKAEYKAEIRSTADIAKMLGVTVSLPPLAPKEERNHELNKRVDQPAVHIDGTRVASKAGRPFAVEILVGGSPRAPKVEDGEAFVDVRRDELYEVKVYNQTKNEAAITLTIDGLDQFTFSEDRDPATGKPKFSHYIVAPGGSVLIKGWHRTNDPKRNDNVLSFLVTEYGKGAASQRKSTGKVGVLTVTFALAWEGDAVPEDEKGSRDAGNETGFGPPQKVGIQHVKRNIGVVRDVVSVRYTR